jgi:hypothetical protein
MISNGSDLVSVLDSQPKILFVADPGSTLSAPVLQIVQERVGSRTVSVVANMSEINSPGPDGEPAIIVIVQDWPDQYSIADANLLISRFPLARLVCCYGPWCDSDGRTRSIWPLAVRVPAAVFAARFDQELQLVSTSGGQLETAAGGALHSPARSKVVAKFLPLTASRSEIFEFDCNGPWCILPPSIVVRVISPDRRWREMVAKYLTECGASLAPDGQTARVDVVVFDADPWNEQRAVDLSAIRAKCQGARLVACLGYPRPEITAKLKEHGADQVWFKLQALRTLAQPLATAVTRA